MTTVTVTDRSALASTLRGLKLSGMLATLDARLAQARAGELGHLDFLQVLCQDEISRRQSMSLTRRVRRARFETEATLEGFDFAASPKLPAAQIRDLAALRWLQSGESVILYGPVSVDSQLRAIADPLGRLLRRRTTTYGVPGEERPATAAGSGGVTSAVRNRLPLVTS